MGLRLREPLQRRRFLYPAASPQDRPPVRGREHRDGAGRRATASRRTADGLSRLPIRLRVTLVFAGIMAVVLAATGLFLRLRLEAQPRPVDRPGPPIAKPTAWSHDPPGELHLGEPVRSALKARGASFAAGPDARGGALSAPCPARGPAAARARPGRGRRRTNADLRRALRRSGTRKRAGSPAGHPVSIRGPAADRRGRYISRRAPRRPEEPTTLLLIGGPVALLLASLAAYGTVGAALRPVDAMRRRAADISAAEVDQRLPVPRASDELRRLGETLNEMLDRLEAALERERAFVDDASHELRTPLALHKERARAGAAVWGEQGGASRARSRRRSRRRTVSRSWPRTLLILARADKGMLSVEPSQLEVRGCSPRFGAVWAAPPGRRAGRSNVDDPDGLTVEADLPGSSRHSPIWWRTGCATGTVRSACGPARRDDGVELHVSDAGPGFPPEFLPHAFERFRRADPARSESGAGLGLAIVDAIAQAHSGQAAARNTPDGGADVWIELGRAG